jgi:hypothetical protein
VVALDALEQLHTDSLNLIGTDAGGDGVAHGIEVGFQKSVGERPHDQMRGGAVLENRSPIADDRDRRMQRVRLAAQQLELLARRRSIGWLGKATLAERQV